MSSFSVAGTTVTFDVVDTSFNDKGGPLEEITVGLLIENATDWGALFSLRSWDVSVKTFPGGNDVDVQIGGGAGEGTLLMDNFDSHQAIMTAISRGHVDGGIRSVATATWLITV